MTKQEFDVESIRILQYYGKDKFDRIHFESLWKYYEKYPKDILRQVIDIVFEQCSYPPKLMDMLKAQEELRQRNIRKPMEFKALPPPDNTFWPTDEYFDETNRKLKDELPGVDLEYVKRFMVSLRETMKSRNAHAVVGIKYRFKRVV